MPSWLISVRTSWLARIRRSVPGSSSARRSVRKPSLSCSFSGKFIALMKSATEIGSRGSGCAKASVGCGTSGSAAGSTASVTAARVSGGARARSEVKVAVWPASGTPCAASNSSKRRMISGLMLSAALLLLFDIGDAHGVDGGLQPVRLLPERPRGPGRHRDHPDQRDGQQDGQHGEHGSRETAHPRRRALAGATEAEEQDRQKPDERQDTGDDLDQGDPRLRLRAGIKPSSSGEGLRSSGIRRLDLRSGQTGAPLRLAGSFVGDAHDLVILGAAGRAHLDAIALLLADQGAGQGRLDVE
jgi:hypothetical protein